MTPRRCHVDVVIAGAGLAGMATACELLDYGKSVLLIDKDKEAHLGGLARESFGGVHLIGTPHQRRLGIQDNPELAYGDWESYAEFSEGDTWPRHWAKYYCENSIPGIYEFLTRKGVTFLPLVNWPERGYFRPGNAVPRWHVAWGSGFELVDRIRQALADHAQRRRLEIWFGHEVSGIDTRGDRAVGLFGRSMQDGSEFRVTAEHVVIASGGIGGGNLATLRENWHRPWGPPPEMLLNGAHEFGNGMLHRKVSDIGGNVTHLDRHWLYAAGIHHPAKRRPHDGLSLVPPRSALWFNAEGKRIGPPPLVSYTDTRHLVEAVLKEPGQYSWQVLNWKIALKELAVSGCDYMTAFRYKRRLRLLRNVLFGDKALVNRLVRECPEDIVTDNTLEGLAEQMNARSLFGLRVDAERLRADIASYDDEIDRGQSYFNDEQLRRLLHFRTYRGDRIRTCRFQKILDPGARPLIAIREFLLSRKSLGGIQTDLSCRVLKAGQGPIPGLYAVGEAAGFGGGGIHGLRSLEGTFLGSCILTARVAGRFIGSCG